MVRRLSKSKMDCAGTMAELVDAADLKSADGNVVRFKSLWSHELHPDSMTEGSKPAASASDRSADSLKAVARLISVEIWLLLMLGHFRRSMIQSPLDGHDSSNRGHRDCDVLISFVFDLIGVVGQTRLSLKPVFGICYSRQGDLRGDHFWPGGGRLGRSYGAALGRKPMSSMNPTT